jgi:hypothetical protein
MKSAAWEEEEGCRQIKAGIPSSIGPVIAVPPVLLTFLLSSLLDLSAIK